MTEAPRARRRLCSMGLHSPFVWPIATVLVLAFASCGDTDGQGNEFGPLAVIEAGDIRYEALGGTGPVEIGDSCVIMTRENGDRLLLVWREGDVRWDAQSMTITFSPPELPQMEPFTIADGEVITIAGRPLVNDGAPVTVPWVATPHPACTGEPWDVASVLASPPPGALEEEP